LSPGQQRETALPDLRETLEYAKAQVAAIPTDDLRKAGIYRTPLEYYLVGTYPPLKYLHDVDQDEVYAGITPSQNVYLHTPFCEQYCTFCHFYKEINAGTDRVETYLTAMRREIDVVAEMTGGLHASSVYFGGGTPSYLRAGQLTGLFEHLWRRVEVTADTEITFELHPGVVRQPDYEDRLDAIAAGRVNRWVFGIQSMDEKVLTTLNRGHGRAEVYRLLDLLAARGIDNLNVDLIFGLPFQTVENWYSTLTDLLAAGLSKFNIFPLMFKRSDPITRHYIRSPEDFPDAETRLTMHYMAEYVLGAMGFTRGPVFYYSRAGEHSQQQNNKFDSIEEDNLVGLGVSSFGYIGGTQYYNVCDNNDYLRWTAEGRTGVWKGHTLSDEERVRRAVMFGVRAGGVDFAALERAFGVDGTTLFAPQLKSLTDLGLVELADRHLRLTDLGCTFVDGIGHIFASDEVRQKVLEANDRIESPSVDPVDRYDYSPIGRTDLPGGIQDRHRDRVTR
jgi:oxygen-independent coproporphyrinogen III oxidase